MTKRKRTSTSSPRARKKATKEGRDARELENARCLDKLPPELWEKILDELKGDDLFPLALSCRYFRQKQKELVARTRQQGRESGKPRLTLKTNLERKLQKGQPVSAEYLKFARKEKASRGVGRKKAGWIRELAAYHGYLPLLQELQAGLKTLDSDLSMDAGESSFHSLFLFFFVSASDFSLSLLNSARRPTGDLAVADRPTGRTYNAE